MSARRRCLLVLLAGALAGCLSPRPAARPQAWQARPAPALQRLLDPRDARVGHAWLGADVASSVPLADGRVVWLFGDTLIGDVRHDCPPPLAYCDRDVDDDHGMIANSLGVMRRHVGGEATPIVTTWQGDTSPPRDAVAALDAGEFLWPMAVARVGDVVVATASRHTRARGLYSLGSVFLRVQNTTDPVAAWRWEIAPAVPSHPEEAGRAQLTWMTALVPHGAHVYVFGQRGTGLDSVTHLARLPAAALSAADWVPALDFLLEDDGAPAWHGTFDPERAWVVPGLPGTTEATVHHDRRLGWYSFRIPPLTFEIRLYVAERLEGPWLDRGVVYRLPERWRDAVRADGQPRYAAYAVKAHPWWSAGDEIVLTYNVNLQDGTYETAVDAAEREHDFYVPQVLRVGP